MKRLIVFLLAATLFLWLASCETPSPQSPEGTFAAPTSQQSASGLAKNGVKMVPFKASYTWEVIPDQEPPEPCFMYTVLRGSGHSSHGGVFDVQQSHCFEFPPSYPNLKMIKGQATCTYANGDQLEITYGGNFDIQLGPNGPFAVKIYGNLNIVGGTGRFEGATGWATFSSTAPYPASPFVGLMTMEGEVSSVGSVKWSEE